MEFIIRNVKDIEGDKRTALENVLGQKLQDNQQLLIHVITVGAEPSPEERDAALSRASAIARQGRVNAAAAGVPTEEVDAAIEHAIQDYREQKK